MLANVVGAVVLDASRAPKRCERLVDRCVESFGTDVMHVAERRTGDEEQCLAVER
jgi:hypothetical protein